MSSSSHKYHNRNESSKGRKHSSAKDSKHKRHHPSRSSVTVPGNDLRFLFVVNEVVFNPEFDEQRYPLDSWLNYIPPSEVEAYGGEYVGQVFQYNGGQVNLAPEYRWHRPQTGVPGSITRRGATGTLQHMLTYKTNSIFAISPHLPIIVAECDVSCDPTFVYRHNCSCQDPAYSLSEPVLNEPGLNAPSNNEPTRWNLLCFVKEKRFSQVNSVGLDSPYVYGGNPSWIPSLVPRAFENPDPNAPRSTGLGGDLSTLIGLMAFHGRRESASEVFSGGNWQQNRWHGRQNSPHTYSNGFRGFIVTIALNIPHEEDFTDDTIEALKADFETYEWNTIFVRE